MVTLLATLRTFALESSCPSPSSWSGIPGTQDWGYRIFNTQLSWAKESLIMILLS